jgi:dihydrofolate reductase
LHRSFVSALVQEDLIDEYYFFLNPTALGQGESVFRLLDQFRRLKLLKSITYDCGIVLLNYARA